MDDGARHPISKQVWGLRNGVRLADTTSKDIKLNRGIHADKPAIKSAGLKPEMR